MSDVQEKNLILQRFYAHCASNSDRVYLTQPHSGGQTTDYTRGQVLEQARLMATHLESLGLEPRSRIAMISKNCVHFIKAKCGHQR